MLIYSIFLVYIVTILLEHVAIVLFAESYTMFALDHSSMTQSEMMSEVNEF